MPTQKKIDTVDDLRKKLGKTKSLFLTDYKGLTHQQLETLRKSLKKVSADFVIAKNRLLKIALKEWNAEGTTHLDDAMNNPTATLLAYGDEIAAVKALAEFIKTAQLPKIKMGLFGGVATNEADFKKLALLPTRDILLATLALRLKSPIYGLHNAMRWNLVKLVIALNNVKEKKPSN